MPAIFSDKLKCRTLLLLGLVIVLTALNLYSRYCFDVTVELHSASDRNYPLVYLQTDGTYDKSFSAINDDLRMHYRMPMNVVRFMVGEAYSFVDLHDLSYPPLEHFKSVAVNGVTISTYEDLPQLLEKLGEARIKALMRLFVVLVVCEILLAFLIMRFGRKSSVFWKALGRCWRGWWARPVFTNITVKLNRTGRRWHDFKPWRIITRTKVLKLLILLLVCAAVVVWRRPDQIWHAYVWSEDGSHILWQYMLFGWSCLGETVNGNYVFSSKIINIIAYKISFWYYPEIAALLSNLFIMLMVCLIAYAPTHLKAPWWCAIAALFVKTGAECFGVALYSFWWAGLLLILAVMWRNDRRFVLRLLCVLVGGFSSPIILVAVLMFVVLAAVTRNKKDIITAVVAFVPFFAQLNRSFGFGGTSVLDLLTFETWFFAVRNFLGTFVDMYGSAPALLVWGLVLLAVIVLAGFKPAGGVKAFIRGNLYYGLLFLWLLFSIAASIYRQPLMLGMPEPFFEPYQRYFFYPSILLSWLSIWIIASSGNAFPRVLVKLFLIVVLLNFTYLGYYKDMRIAHAGDLNWREELCNAITCEDAEPYPIELYYFGLFKNDYAEKLEMRVSKDNYIRLVQESWLYKDACANCDKLYN